MSVARQTRLCGPAAGSVSVAARPSTIRRSRAVPTAAYVSQAQTSTAQQHSEQRSLLNTAINTVMALFSDDTPSQAVSEELQLPPELKAYLEEMEAQGSGHGSWMHSHIAERLASTSGDALD